jgi:cupin superfamily acireductone dioxygenase involved in methionine salvage
LNQVIKRKTDDADALEQQFRNQSIQLEELSRKLYEMDIEHKAEINHITQNYEEHIYHIKQENQAKFDDIMALKLRDSPSKQNL